MSEQFTIAVENSTWNNVGDAFYQTSLASAFRIAFPGYRVVEIDGPIRRAFRFGRTAAAPFDARFHTVADHYVFSGPILGKNFLSLYAPHIKKILEAGKSYSLLSVRAGVDGASLQEVRAFLEAHPPRAIYTRAPSSLKRLTGIVEKETSGPCFAFFVRELDSIPTIDAGSDYLSVSVYTSREPNITFEGDGGAPKISDLHVDWHAQPNARSWKILKHLEWWGPCAPKHDIPWQIVRPVQGHNRYPHLTFSKPNSYISYNPMCYLGVIKNGAGVISDRVHAGVAGLSFGLPVNILEVDERYDLYTDIPLQTDGDFWRLDARFLDQKYQDVLAWLKGIDLADRMA